MTFFDRDRQSGEMWTSSFNSIAGNLRRLHPVAVQVPKAVRDRLDVAIELLALGYEQANRGRMHLFLPLTDSAITAALVAFERMLRHVLDIPDETVATLGWLLEQAQKSGMLSSAPELEVFWKGLRESRNELAHGDPRASHFGATAAGMVAGVIALINRLAGA